MAAHGKAGGRARVAKVVARDLREVSVYLRVWLPTETNPDLPVLAHKKMNIARPHFPQKRGIASAYNITHSYMGP